MNNNNLDLYDRLRTVPDSACREITSGELAGFTNITPQWRIETLTREFGPCGIGWYYDRPEYRFEKTDDGEVICFCSTNLYVRYNNEWSKPIPGEGGNKLVSKSNGVATANDECCKMAFTDALSTAAKMLGLAADVYYKEGRDGKYTERNGNGSNLFPMAEQPSALQPTAPVQPLPQQSAPQQPMPQQVCSACGAPISAKIEEFSQRRYGRCLCLDCQKTVQQPVPPIVDSAPISRADALRSVFPFGKYMNKMLSEVIAIDRKTIEFYANDKDGHYRRDYPEFWRACKAVLA